jgi:sucrose phosphorylase
MAWSSRDESADPVSAIAARWLPPLIDVYGLSTAQVLAGDVADVLGAHRSTRSEAGTRRWTEQDVWLITYPDHFQQPGTAPLASLHMFLNEYLRHLCNGVHILPFYPSSSDEGFSITDYLAVDSRFGSWADIEAIASEWRLMVDAVVNHASAQGDWFVAWRADEPEFAGFFRTSDPSADLSSVVRAREHPLLTEVQTAHGPEWVWTTFSPDQVDLDYRNPRVLLRVLDVILTYAAHGADVIRLDAIGFLWKEETASSIHMPQTHRIIQFLRACLDEVYPHVVLITETNVPHEENVSYFGSENRPEAHVVYQFPLPPLVLNAFSRGDATLLREWLGGLEAPTPDTTFLNFLASHDGVGLRPLEGLVDGAGVDALVAATESNGGSVNRRTTDDGRSTPYELNATWLDLIRGPTTGDLALSRHLASHAIMLALRGIPAVYVHGLLASRNDTEAVVADGQARSINRRRFTDLDALKHRLRDPATREARALSGIGDLVRWRTSSPAFHPNADQTILATPASVLGIARRHHSGASARVYVNVTGDRVTIEDPGGLSIRGHNYEPRPDGIQLGAWGNVWIFS